MTALPADASRLRRLLGRIAAGLGLLLALAVLLWLGAYWLARDAVPGQSWRGEAGHWAPVLIFLLPAVLLVMDGRCLLRHAQVPAWVYGELLMIVLVLALAGWAIFLVP
ncbi:MAG: hypothetical protein AB1450_12030 [Pseudomonadota bacterium]